MLKKVIKRDGRTEDFNPEKLNKWAEWATNSGASWSSVVFEANKILPEVCTSSDIQKALIKTCVSRDEKPYHDTAARLMVGMIYKEAFNSFEDLPSLPSFYHNMVEKGLWEEMDYDEEELEELDLELNHFKDFEYPYSALKQIYDKYLVQNRKTKVIYESPQFMYMGVAMDNMRNMPKDRRIDDVKKVYRFLSNHQINLPTPILGGQRTRDKGFASCCLITSEDTSASINAFTNVAYDMTTAKAGIGGYFNSRCLGDPVRDGLITHTGKLPYYRYIDAAIHSTTQMGRRGSGNIYYNIHDLEIKHLLELKHVNTPDSRQIRGMDYTLSLNKFFMKKVLANEDWMLVSSYYAPKLYELCYSKDQELYEEEYNNVLNNNLIPKKVVSAREVMNLANKQWFETGRIYKYFTDNANIHTPFKDPIYSSNLCVTPDTKLLTSEGNIPIGTLVGRDISVWNGFGWSKSEVHKTGENQKIIRVVVDDLRTGHVSTVKCTPYHKFYNEDGSLIRAFQLNKGDILLGWVTPDGAYVKQRVKYILEEENSDTYCLNEPLRNMVVFNGILTGNCNEITLPTKGYKDVTGLYDVNNKDGEVALCFIAAIPAGRVPAELYEEVCYYVTLMLDNVIDEMEYPYPQVSYTAKNRRSIGVGILNLAHYMAKNGKSYKTKDGQKFIHDHAEMHSYYLHKASLRLAKERGTAGWIDKTKYPQGWLPIDTYAKAVDEITTELNFDWESLREEIIETGGIRHSVLEATMPSESSSIATNCTNSIYPIRDFMIKKANKDAVIPVWVPDADNLFVRINYERAWDIKTEDMIKCYGCIQKFHGQAISTDFYFNPSKYPNNVIGTKEQILWIAMMMKWGLKGHYYLNTASDGDPIKRLEEVSSGCESGACHL